jgi:hypothetical protein
VHDGFIYDQGRVNGMRATMIIDTGAALTTFRLPGGFVLGDSELREGHCSFHQNVVVGAFKFLDADGLVGQDVLTASNP